MPEVRRVLIRVGLAALLVGVYVGAWRPGRAVLTRQAAAPALQAVATPRATRFSVTPAGGGLMLLVRDREGQEAGNFRAPAGTLWLVPAVLLLVLFPRRPYWAYLGLLHVGLGGLSLAALAAGLAWGDAGFLVNTFLRTYGFPAVSFAVPVLMWQHERRRRTVPEEQGAGAGEADPG